MRWLLVFGFLNAFGDSSTLDSSDPCAELNLPECPMECPEDFASSCGEECEVEGEECGNSIGDGRICSEGVWSCTVHAPLGGEGECNRVCT